MRTIDSKELKQVSGGGNAYGRTYNPKNRHSMYSADNPPPNLEDLPKGIAGKYPAPSGGPTG